MDTLQVHWAPQLRPNKLMEPSVVSRGLPVNAKPSMSLLDLPRELRDEIYTYLIPNQLSFTMENQCRYRGQKTRRETFKYHYYLAEDPVLLVNRQIRQEMLDAIYAKTTFCFEWRRRASFILRCLEKLPESAKSRIRRLSWKGHSLHTGHDPKTVKGWTKVMRYVATNFAALKIVHCHLPSSENGHHRYHNWEVPRLAVKLLISGKIKELRWFWEAEWFPGQLSLDETISIAVRLLTIPYYENKDSKMGFEYRRLLKDDSQLNENDPADKWALECLMRPKHQLDVETRFKCLLLRRQG